VNHAKRFIRKTVGTLLFLLYAIYVGMKYTNISTGTITHQIKKLNQKDIQI